MPRIRFGSPYKRRGFGGYGRRARGGRGFGGGGKIRLLIGIVIALIALGSYYFNTQVNPFTEENERVSLSLAEEAQLGFSSAPEMVRQMGGAAPPGSEKAQLVRAVGQKLLEAGGVAQVLREKDVPYEFTFTLLDDDRTANAFALPGGPIFITEALFDQLENEAQLAGVLGHEIGHVIERHGAERMRQLELQQHLAGAAAVGAGDYSAGQLANFVGNFITMSYGREQELESDSYGLQYMVDAGYDPSQMVRVMEILRQASGGGGAGPEFMQTHPHPESRIKAIEQFVRENFPDGIPDSLGTGQRLN